MRSINRTGLVSGTGLIIAALTATLAALIFPIWSYADRGGTGLDTLNTQSVSTRFGPLSALDREFITKVRLAGLWELPAGQQAEERGTTQVEDGGRAPRRGPHVPRRARPQRRLTTRTRTPEPAQRPAARLAGHARRRARHGLRPEVREHPAQGARQGLLRRRPGPREHPQLPRTGPRRRREHHRARPHQGPRSHRVRGLRRPRPGRRDREPAPADGFPGPAGSPRVPGQPRPRHPVRHLSAAPGRVPPQGLVPWPNRSTGLRA